MNRAFCRLSVWLAKQLGDPRTFVFTAAVILAALVAAVTCPAWRDAINLWGGAITGYVSILLLLILQNGQNREAAAAQAKADEMIRAMPTARNELIGAEELTAEEIATLRKL